MNHDKEVAPSMESAAGKTAAKPNTDAAFTRLLLVITVRSFSVPLRMTYSETMR